MSQETSQFKTCPYCAEEIRQEAVKCKHCGSEIKKTSKLGSTLALNTSAVIVSVLLIVVAIVGNYHIVYDVQSIFVSRPYFGFSDPVASIEECTNTPYIVAMSQHQSLCTALQNADYLESNESRRETVKENINERMNEVQSCVSNCDPMSVGYSDCVSRCY